MGKEEQADVIEYKAATTVATAPARKADKVKGASVKKQWVAEVTDPIELCKAIINGELPPSILSFKQSELNKLASTWQNQRKFSGLKIFHKSIVASR